MGSFRAVAVGAQASGSVSSSQALSRALGRRCEVCAADVSALH